jgi:GTP cyclohydrolase I
MFNPNKTDPILGRKVEDHLRSLGIHTPTFLASGEPITSDQDKIEKITKNFASIMGIMGLDLEDDSLKDTPRRVAKMFVSETMWGLKPENFPKMMLIDNKMGYDEMLVERDVSVMSLCEHHFVTIEGKCHIAYIPKSKVAGLSKFNRIVEYFSRRPQVQERLTAQIFETLKLLLGTDDVAVVVDSKHYCVISRGVEDESSTTITSAVGGVFRQPNVKSEFLSLIKKS